MNTDVALHWKDGGNSGPRLIQLSDSQPVPKSLPAENKQNS